MNGDIGTLAAFFREAERIIFFTGAGMSTESGIPDFRSDTGLYASGVSESVFDIEEFRRRPDAPYQFKREFLGTIQQAKPNAGHHAIAALEHQFRKDVQVVTQNIDTLHQQAGSTVVHPVHGTVATSHCLRCGLKVQTETILSDVEAGRVPRHEACGGVFKPDIVFFGEMLPEDIFAAADRAIQQADLLVVAGTSLVVYPAAALPSSRRADCRLVIINQMPTHLDDQADLRFDGPLGAILKQAVDLLME